MAKKKQKKVVDQDLLNVFQGKISNNNSPGGDEPGEMTEMYMDQLSDAEKGEFMLMWTLASAGVTPEDYAQFYHIFQTSTTLAESFSPDCHDDDLFDDDNLFSFLENNIHRSKTKVKEYTPLKNADEYTLVLKIQLKDVTNPPMWRQVEIPADFNFLQLHKVIQRVTGLEDVHLWQFNVKAYDNALQIGVKMDSENLFGPGWDSLTHIAGKTPVTQFLQHTGDKLEYVYDFGDDWIFVVEVKDLISKKIEYPVCRKYKTELNALEDSGGVWVYGQVRHDLEHWDMYSEKEKIERLENLEFDSEDEYLYFLKEHCINLDDLNESLKSL